MLEQGLNCIITSKFMIIVPLRHPFNNFEGHDLFILPLAYMGYVHLPVLTKIFPYTAFE